jgi:hypothetical protein
MVVVFDGYTSSRTGAGNISALQAVFNFGQLGWSAKYMP